MNIDRQLDDMSREQLYSLIKELKEENTSQKTEITKYKQLTNDYQKYFDEINETFVSKTKVIQKDISNKKKELDSLKTLNAIEPQSDGESNGQISDKKQTKIWSKSGKQNIKKKYSPKETPQTSVKKKIKREKTDEEEVPELSSNKLKKKRGLNSTKALESESSSDSDLDDNSIGKNLKIIKTKISGKRTNSFEGTDNQSVVKNKNKREDNTNECKPRIDCIKTEPNCVESEESDIEFIDIPKKESELVEVSDTSDEEPKESEKQSQSDEQMTQTSSQYPKQCEWKGCSYRLISRNAERFHLNKHMRKYRCDVCGHISRDNNHLKKHRVVKHSNALTFVCPLKECKQIFKSEVLLRTHHKYVHKLVENNSNEVLIPQKKQMSDNSNENIEQNCSQKRRSDNNCDTYKSLKIQRIDNSKVMTESNDKSEPKNSIKSVFECPLEGCSLLFKFGHFLRKHLFSYHQKSGKYWDKRIDNSKRDINLYSAQQLAYLKGGYVCDYKECGKEFKQLKDLLTHKETHPGKEYKCCWLNCTADFKSYTLFNRHLNVHKRTYTCNWKGCDFIGEDEWMLRQHKNVHLEDKICCICNKTFIEIKTLRQHLTDVHKLQGFLTKSMIQSKKVL